MTIGKHRTTVSIDEGIHMALTRLVDAGAIESVSAFMNDALTDFVAAVDLYAFVADDYRAAGFEPPLAPFESLEAYQSSAAQQRLREAHQAWLSTLEHSSPTHEATRRLLSSYAEAVDSISAPGSSHRSGEAAVA